MVLVSNSSSGKASDQNIKLIHGKMTSLSFKLSIFFKVCLAIFFSLKAHCYFGWESIVIFWQPEVKGCLEAGAAGV